ncbi:MAG: branched-chain amino acid ABC transporter permease [Halobacteriales archaeon]|nr:branched-chain amino acid ABC transporter permease [Halobacteriales archaeon]
MKLGRDARDGLVLLAAVLAVFGAFAALGLGTGYMVNAGILIALFALFSLGLALQFGQAGLVNFGQVGFAAIGAYAVGIAHLQGWPMGWGVLLGLAAAALFAALLGIPTLRLREDYLAIVTIGFAEILRIVATSEVWLTQGPLGIRGFPRPGLEWATQGAWASFAARLGANPYPLFVLALALLLTGLSYAALALLVRSPWGRVLKAIREDEGVAEALGKDTFRFKLQALAIGALPGALFGMLFAWAYAQVVPDNFTTINTFYAVIIVVLGGLGNLRGALAGSVVLWGLISLAQVVKLPGPLAFLSQAGPAQYLVVGLVLIALMMFRPQGLVGRREEMLFGK